VGYLFAEDLRGNSSRWQEILGVDRRRATVWFPPPHRRPLGPRGPCFRDDEPVWSQGPFDHNNIAYLHTFTEATKQTSRTAWSSAIDQDIKAMPLDQLL
jgi:hypothetical protein